ncbi:MAG: DMT family transporter [Chroococcidiopsidaceae cyanobacterium CP_BM_ER_R8_30]|nr:DMT family transporter [Chroococcidiopsidaceae cyanobacterium CP_BM_ER_R8_30]
MRHFQGEIAALCAAFLWAVSSIIYTRLGQSIPPLELNLLKGAIAIPLLLLTLFLNHTLLLAINPTAVCLLLLSGVMGIGVGDTAFFVTLNCLGARRALLMETLAPPIAAILALIFLQEQLSAGAWCGIFLTILGVAGVITERVPGGSDASADWVRGISFGLVAAMALATGAVLSHKVLATTSIDPLWAALLRLSAGVLVLLPWKWLRQRQYGPQLKALRSGKVIGGIFVAAFAGTYLGIWLQQMALKFTAAGITLTLTNTSPLFVLPIAACLGERVSLRAIVGVLIAIIGIGLLFSLR